MGSSDNIFRQEFYQALVDRPLDPEEDARWYVPLYDARSSAPSDPIDELQATIEWSKLESTQLFSGFGGTGKTTELKRLKRRLEANGAVVVHCDMLGYLNPSTPVDVSDFLLATAGAFGEELAKDTALLGEPVIKEGYWTRFRNFLARTHVEFGDIGGDLKLNLKADPSFRERLQERLRGHLGALVKDVHGFFGECIVALRRHHRDDELRVVLLLDSMEKVVGTTTNAPDVATSLETLFRSHADKLKLPYMHVVYSVPPWLKIKAPGIAQLYSGAQWIPCVKVEHRNGQAWNAGLNELERIVAKRGDWQRLLGGREALDELLRFSGGYLRDLFRLLQVVLRLSRHDPLPVSDRIRTLALDELRNSYLPISNDDARWLERIRTTHNVELDGQEKLHELARFYDLHLVLTYRNGDEWVSVHPLIAGQVQRQAAALKPQGDGP